MIVKYRNWISQTKHLLHRGYSYVGILGIGLVVAESAQNILLNAGIPIPIYILYPAGVFALLTIGIIDKRFGFHRKELEIITGQNAFLLERLDAILNEVRK